MLKIALAAALIAAIVPGSLLAAPTINYTPNLGGTFGNDDPTTYRPHFYDIYQFGTNYARTVAVEVTSSHSIKNGKADFSRNVNFISNGVKLNAKLIPATSTGQYERRYLANFRIPAGVQKIFVRGASGVNGQYSGFLTFSGVPEASTWIMMIFGFGLVGGAMRRRTSQNCVAYA